MARGAERRPLGWVGRKLASGGGAVTAVLALMPRANVAGARVATTRASVGAMLMGLCALMLSALPVVGPLVDSQFWARAPYHGHVYLNAAAQAHHGHRYAGVADGEPAIVTQALRGHQDPSQPLFQAPDASVTLSAFVVMGGGPAGRVHWPAGVDRPWYGGVAAETQPTGRTLSPVRQPPRD